MRMHAAARRHFTGERFRSSAKEFRELTQIVNRCGDVAAKVRIQPLCVDCAFAAKGQFIAALFNKELLQLDSVSVKACTEHNDVGFALAPTKAG